MRRILRAPRCSVTGSTSQDLGATGQRKTRMNTGFEATHAVFIGPGSASRCLGRAQMQRDRCTICKPTIGGYHDQP
jgi:hypothetical protein